MCPGGSVFGSHKRQQLNECLDEGTGEHEKHSYLVFAQPLCEFRLM